MGGDHVHQLVQAEQQKVHAHVNVHRAHAVDGRTQPETGHCVFSERGTETALWSELLDQTFGAVEDALVVADVDAVDKNTGVAAHFLGHRLVQRVAITDHPAHAYTSS